MTAPRLFHLFNCDRVYKLDSIEDLLTATKAKLGLDFSVVKHYFSLSEIPEISTQTIPELQLDCAFLAVHANESRLSINENTGGGYTEIYRALLEATGENVVVVIGGDDNYKNESEEEQSVISRWAWRRIARSQFSEEFIDGRKGFVFSWDKKHREIHEEALLHYFDPEKKGQKFEYQPRTLHIPADPADAQTVVIANDERTPRENKQEHPLSQVNAAQEEKLSGLSGGFTNEKAVTHHTEERAQAKVELPVVITEEREPEGREVALSRTEYRDLAVLGCNVSAESLQLVQKVIDDISPRLNLSRNPSAKNLSPVDIKWYLMRNPVRFCVLVVDEGTLRDAYECSSERKFELEDLIRTAADKVVDKVIFTICGPCHPPSREEDTLLKAHAIEGILKEKGKGLTVWLEDGKLNVEPDVLMQLMLQTSTMEDTTGRERDLGEFPTPANVTSETSQAKPREQFAGPSRQEPYHATHLVRLPEGEIVKPPQPQLPAAPNYDGLQLDVNEALMLKTRICYGKVSFKPEDVEFTYPGWVIPQHLKESLEREQFATHNGELFVISDEKGNLKYIERVYSMPFMERCLLV